MKDLNILNKSIVYLELYAEDPRETSSILSLGRATGFIWKKETLFFLVTNWHVLTGRDHNTGALKGNIKPKFIQIIYNSSSGSLVRKTLELYSDNGSKKWLQASQNKTNCIEIPETDIAILPLESLCLENDRSPLNDILHNNSARTDVLFEVTTPLFILGYPIQPDLSANIESPSWVTGYVATTPTEESPTFWINAYSYFGMSGAPVLWVFPNRPIKLTNGGGMSNSSTGEFIQFAGIYSGRMFEIKENQTAAPLARIWKAELIDEILS